MSEAREAFLTSRIPPRPRHSYLLELVEELAAVRTERQSLQDALQQDDDPAVVREVFGRMVERIECRTGPTGR